MYIMLCFARLCRVSPAAHFSSGTLMSHARRHALQPNLSSPSLRAGKDSHSNASHLSAVQRQSPLQPATVCSQLS